MHAILGIGVPVKPFSTLCSVVRLISARSAIVPVGMRRRRRASRMSSPSGLLAQVYQPQN